MSASSNEPQGAGQEFFNEFLARVRLERGLTWAELAGLLGIGQARLGSYLRGDSLPRTKSSSAKVPHEKLALYAKVLACPLDYVTACWQQSMDGRPRSRQAVCQRGHDMPPGAATCPECRAFRRERDKRTGATAARNRKRQERLNALTCTACGKRGIRDLRTGLCAACDRSNRLYGDPLASLHTSKPGYRGVGHVAPTSWQAQIMHHGKLHSLGCFTSPEAAARAYDAKALELRGDKARLNFPRVTAHSTVTTEAA